MSGRVAVVTGGPFSGKTTLIEALGEAGFQTVPEAAIEVIAQLNEELGLEQQKRWRLANMTAFQERVILRQLELEEQLLRSDEPLAVLDRGRHDGLAYCRYFDQPVPAALEAALEGVHYDHVLLLDTLSDFGQRGDTGRHDSRNQSLALRDLLHEIYVEYGHEPVFVPEKPVQERVELVRELLRPSRPM